jgi:hypothetical protein
LYGTLVDGACLLGSYDTVDRQQEQIVMSADNGLLVLTPQEIGRDILETYQYPSLSRIGAINYDKKTGDYITHLLLYYYPIR